MRQVLVWIGCAGLLGLAYPLSGMARPVMENAPVGLTREQTAALEEKAQASLLGQFRGSMSDFLYLQVEKYVHAGVELRPMTEAEKQKKLDAVTSTDGIETGTRQHGGTETTVVPEKKNDWRSVLGDIERDVRPFQSMNDHRHKEPKESLQLYRLMTWSNPKFIRGWTEGGWIMARTKEVGAQKALAFLREGEKANPESIEIAFSQGWLLQRELKRMDEASSALKRAIALGAVRDPGTLTTDEQEALQSAYRFLVVNRRDVNDIGAGRHWALEGLRRFPDDVTCQRFLREYPETKSKKE
jgi:hypothetical protein